MFSEHILRSWLFVVYLCNIKPQRCSGKSVLANSDAQILLNKTVQNSEAVPGIPKGQRLFQVFTP